MRLDDYRARLERLVEQGKLVASAVEVRDYAEVVDAEVFSTWAVSGLHALRLTFGEQSDHYVAFKRQADRYNGWAEPVPYCQGILLAAVADLKAGLFVRVSEIAAAEVFGDLLAQAEYLLSNGNHHLPAAALAGAVLEDALRKLCAKHGVAWQPPSSISKLNVELYKANIYGKPQHGQVEAWGKLRNQVDHGDFKDPSEVDSGDVRRMVEGVRDFLVKHLT